MALEVLQSASVSSLMMVYVDADEDRCVSSPCINGADCRSVSGGFSCNPCPLNFTGDRCQFGTQFLCLTVRSPSSHDSCPSTFCNNGRESNVELVCESYRVIARVTGHLSEGSFVRNVVVQIPKFDTKPNPKPNANHSPNSNYNPNPNPNPNQLALTLTQTLTLTLALAIALTYLCPYFSDK